MSNILPSDLNFTSPFSGEGTGRRGFPGQLQRGSSQRKEAPSVTQLLSASVPPLFRRGDRARSGVVNRFSLLPTLINWSWLPGAGRWGRILWTIQEVVCYSGLVMSAQAEDGSLCGSLGACLHYPHPRAPVLDGFMSAASFCIREATHSKTSLTWTTLEPTHVSEKSSSLGVHCVQKLCSLSVNGMRLVPGRGPQSSVLSKSDHRAELLPGQLTWFVCRGRMPPKL